jgi:hypothetical protein
LLAVILLQFQPGAVERIPHLIGEGGANRASVGTGDFDAVADRGRIFRAEAQEIMNIGFVRGLMVLTEQFLATCCLDAAFPFGSRAAIA